MASFETRGFIIGVKYNQNNVVVTLSENRNGYRKSDGTIVADSVINWRVTYKAVPFKKYISSHFSSGMYVEVKGEILPCVFGDEGAILDGYTILGQTINMASFPKKVQAERKMIKESQGGDMGEPDVEAYMTDDF